MIRDVNLLRSILLEIEADTFQGKGISPSVVAHLSLLQEAGFIMVQNISTLREVRWIVTGITWKGYELLDAIRSDREWSAVLTQTGTDAPFDVIARVAEERSQRQHAAPQRASQRIVGQIKGFFMR